jgi:hypothetical protein
MGVNAATSTRRRQRDDVFRRQASRQIVLVGRDEGPAPCAAANDESTGSSTYRWRVVVVMARLRRALGDVDGALELIEEAARATTPTFPQPSVTSLALSSRVGAAVVHGADGGHRHAALRQ